MKKLILFLTLLLSWASLTAHDTATSTGGADIDLLLAAANDAAFRTEAGLAIGTDVQAFGAVLDDLNTLGANSADSEFLVGTGAGALAWESAATALTSIGAESATSNDIDPDRLLGDTVDDNTIDNGLLDADLQTLANGNTIKGVIPVNTETTSRNIAATDLGDKILVNTSGGAVTLTIVAGLQANSSFYVELSDATNAVTIAAGASVTLTGDTPTLSVTGKTILVEHTNTTNTWRVVGSTKKGNETFMILEPDAVQGVSDDIILKKFVAEEYPKGVTINAIHIDASAAYTSEIFLFEHWDDASGTTQATVESITASAISTEDDGTLTDATIPADYFLVVNLDDTPEDKAYVAITVDYSYE